MEGKKAFILPAVAALVLGVLLLLRSGASDLGAGAAAPRDTSVEARVLAAIAQDADARLKPSALSKLQPLIEAAAQACAAQAGDVSRVKVSLQVAAASGVGAIVQDAQATGLPPAAADCVHTTLRAFEGPDIGQTGRMSTTMTLSLAPTKGEPE